MSQRRENWTYRLVDADGDPFGPEKSYAFVIPAPIDEAAEAIAEMLDEQERRQERQPLEEWPIGELDGVCRVLDLMEAPTIWKRFTVQCEVVLKYRATVEGKS